MATEQFNTLLEAQALPRTKKRVQHHPTPRITRQTHATPVTPTMDQPTSTLITAGLPNGAQPPLSDTAAAQSNVSLPPISVSHTQPQTSPALRYVVRYVPSSLALLGIAY